MRQQRFNELSGELLHLLFSVKWTLNSSDLRRTPWASSSITHVYACSDGERSFEEKSPTCALFCFKEVCSCIKVNEFTLDETEWMEGSRSIFAASQLHTSGWQPVHKTTLDIFWKNGNLKCQKCVGWRRGPWASPVQMHFLWSPRCSDMNMAQTSESHQWGFILAHHPFHRSSCIAALRNGINHLKSHGFPHS